MQLVEQHIINKNHKFYNECDELCFKAKNLYNACLYEIKQAYMNNVNVLGTLHHIMKTTDSYKSLPAKVASSVLLMVQKNFKSFFKSNADYYKNPHKYKGKPKLPKYLDKVNGRFVASYTNQAVSKKIFKKQNKIKLSNTNIEFKTKITDFNILDCVRIIPRLGYYVIEVVYTFNENPKLEDNKQYLSLDLGVKNLATATTNNKNLKPFVINGKPLLAINQFYNKKKAYYSSCADKRKQSKTTNKIKKLNLKRQNKINNYIHKASKYIVSYAKVNNLNTIVVGYNNQWKTDINLGNKNNQNFVNIPYSRFIDLLKYKCEIQGINIIITEESYTSKCSFLDNEEIKKHSSYLGKRKHRGLFISSTGKQINADVNGSYNILRKAVPNAFAEGIEGYGVNPVVITIKK